MNAVIMCNVSIFFTFLAHTLQILIKILENLIAMPALLTYYARNYAGIIGPSLYLSFSYFSTAQHSFVRFYASILLNFIASHTQ